VFAVASISFAWLELMLWGLTLPARPAEDLPAVPLPGAPD